MCTGGAFSCTQAELELQRPKIVFILALDMRIKGGKKKLGAQKISWKIIGVY
jgi:hypothetical protein